MRPALRWPGTGLLTVCLSALAIPAIAQSETGVQPERPADALFQRGVATQGANTERLALTLGALTSHDANGAGQLLGAERALAGAAGEFNVGLAYTKPLRKALFGASASGGWRHHQEMTDLFASSYAAGAGLTGSITRRATLGARASYVASPYYAFSLFPGPETADPAPAETPSRDHAITTRRFQSYETGAAFSRTAGAHGRVNLQAEARRSTLEDDPARLLDVVAGGDYNHDVGRSTALRLGYSFRYGETRSPADRRYTRIHDVDLGFTYRWQRTRTRRTTISLFAGPSMVAEVERERVGWQASAQVGHMIGRSWTLSGHYRRGVRFVVGFEEPFFADALSVSLEGLIGERWRLTVGGGAATGEIGIYDVDGHTVNTRSGSAGLQYAVSRHVALFGSYVYYAYQFGGEVVLPDRELPDLSRSGLRVGMTLWVPLHTRAGHGPR